MARLWAFEFSFIVLDALEVSTNVTESGQSEVFVASAVLCCGDHSVIMSQAKKKITKNEYELPK